MDIVFALIRRIITAIGSKSTANHVYHFDCTSWISLLTWSYWKYLKTRLVHICPGKGIPYCISFCIHISKLWHDPYTFPANWAVSCITQCRKDIQKVTLPRQVVTTSAEHDSKGGGSGVFCSRQWGFAIITHSRNVEMHYPTLSYSQYASVHLLLTLIWSWCHTENTISLCLTSVISEEACATSADWILSIYFNLRTVLEFGNTVTKDSDGDIAQEKLMWSVVFWLLCAALDNKPVGLLVQEHRDDVSLLTNRMCFPSCHCWNPLVKFTFIKYNCMQDCESARDFALSFCSKCQNISLLNSFHMPWVCFFLGECFAIVFCCFPDWPTGWRAAAVGSKSNVPCCYIWCVFVAQMYCTSTVDYFKLTIAYVPTPAVVAGMLQCKFSCSILKQWSIFG